MIAERRPSTIRPRGLSRALVFNERGLRRRYLTFPLRLVPDFLIIGAQKGGTTSLYTYLCRHPDVLRSARAEIHFFDQFYDRGLGWYRAHFATSLERKRAGRRGRSRVLTGEATPYYIAHPHVAKRVRLALPSVKVIALLRNPVDRANSHYQHNRRLGREPLSFEEAIENETVRIGEGEGRIREDERHLSKAYRIYSYLARGLYADQLAVWLGSIDRDQMLILRSEDLFEEPDRVYMDVLRFLGLREIALPAYEVLNPGGYGSDMPSDTRRRLIEYFRPHNERLPELVGWEPGWDQ